MIRKEMRQLCPTCKGSGTNNRKPLTTPEGKALLAPVYEKGEGNRQQFANCVVCNGEGYTLQPSPRTIHVDGEKVNLSDDEFKARYDINYS